MIGTNKSDAAQTVRALLADHAATTAPTHRPRLTDLLAARGVRPVSYAAWLGIDRRERELAAELGRATRVKLSGWDELNRATGPRPTEG